MKDNKPNNALAYWRSLEELSQSPEVIERLEQEFPGYDAKSILSISRRRFVQLMGASMALAGLTLSGCRRWPKETLAPYSSAPQGTTPGVEEYYATMWERSGVAQPLMITSFDGRPIKVEGNPLHPMTATFDGLTGSSDRYSQGSLLEMYDPERSRSVVNRTSGKAEQSDWAAFEKFAGPLFKELLANKGKGLAILAEPSQGPTYTRLIDKLRSEMPQASVCHYEPLAANHGLGPIVGNPLVPQVIYDLSKADVIVSLDADLLDEHPAHLKNARDWSARRRSADEGSMSRLYIAEARLSITGSVADNRLPVRPSRLMPILNGLMIALGLSNVLSLSGGEELSADEKAFIASAAADLKKAGKAGVVAVGETMPVYAHELALSINGRLLGSTGSVVKQLKPGRLEKSYTIDSLTKSLNAGSISTLLILGGNPAFDAPADLNFAKAMTKATHCIRLGLYEDETSEQSTWHLPRAHYLECWGDGRAADGTVGVAQPLILPLFGGKSTIELLATLLDEKITDGQSLVRATIDPMLGGGDTERKWRRVLHDGMIAGTAFDVESRALEYQKMAMGLPSAKGFELRFVRSHGLYDGRFANNGWMQELPDPATKLTWDNAALISVKDAKEQGLTTGDMVELSVNGRSMKIAVYVQPGQPVGVITLPVGHGRTVTGSIGSNDGVACGFNTYYLRTTDSMWYASGASIKKTGEKYKLIATQDHHLIDAVGAWGRDVRIGDKNTSGTVIREATFEEYKANKHFARGEEGAKIQLFQAPNSFNDPHAWGMTIDMATCIGCNACVVACQAENNIPIVGKENVEVNREMHWLRIDRYFKGGAEDPNPEVVYQPMMCQHCENAPCEQVCPVGATMHDAEGLNVMVYNRCIGTRYCSNNCPYKVRRFNYFDWHSKNPHGRYAAPWPELPDTQQQATIDPIKQMVYNPDVSIRMRGVMEKCTYCLQRIQRAKISKRNHGQDIVDGDIVTACMQSCPTQAIVFGDLMDKTSRVSQLHRKNPRAYAVLDEELNVRPRTHYLALVRNPAEALATADATGGQGVISTNVNQQQAAEAKTIG